MMEKSIKQKIVNAIAAHPKAITLGVSLAIATSLAIAAADASHFGQVAFAPGGMCGTCHNFYGALHTGTGM